MLPPEKIIYRFDEVEVDLSRNCLSLGGEEKHLRQKAFQVLVCLLERRERLVTKNELFEIVWKDIAVTDDVLVQCVKEIRRSIGDDPHRPRFIKTVPKFGYRFIGAAEQVLTRSYAEEITRVEIEFEEETDTIQTSDSTPVMIKEPSQRTVVGLKSINRYSIITATVFAGAIAAMLYFGWRSNSLAADRRPPQSDGRTTVAVMFFENQSNNAEFDWLREGLSNMLAAGLSRSSKLSLLDRERLFDRIGREAAKKGSISNEAALAVSRQSHADVFIVGSFARIGERVRVDVQLHNGESGDFLSTESLTVDKAEQLLTEIDLLTLRIARRLGADTEDGQELSSVTTNNLEAYRFYSLAVEKAHALQSKEAIALLERAIELDPEFAMAHARIGYTYSVTWGRADEGKPYLEKAFRLSSGLTEKDRLNIAAWYAIANGDYSAAIATYRQIINRFPLEIEAYWRLGRLLRGEEQGDEAIAVLKQGLAVDPQAENAYNILGSILSGRGNHEEAIAAHDRYVALAPNEPNAYDSLGLSYSWSGNHERAIEMFEKALAIDTEFGIARIHLANTRIRLGQYNAAIELVRSFIAEASSESERGRGYEMLAYLYGRKGQYAQAEQFASEAFRANSGFAWQAYLLATRRGEKGRMAMLEKSILAPPTYVDRGSRSNARFQSFYRARIAMKNGRYDEAVGHFREVIATAPPTYSFIDYEDSLGVALIDLGRYDEAIAEFDRILGISPNYPLARYHLAEAYRAKGLAEEAKANYLKFLEDWRDADPDLSEIGRARRFL